MEKTNRNKNAKRTEKTEEYVPNITAEAKILMGLIKDQMVSFIGSQAQVDELDVKTRRENEAALFNVGSWPAAIEDPACKDLMIYLLDRSVRTDRETHLLTRASCSIVCTKGGVPAYFLSAYLTKAMSGNICIVPMGDKGPVYRDTLRVNIVDGKIDDQQ